MNIETDLDAEYYVDNSSLQQKLAKELLSSMTIPPSSHVLDVGCGDGRITAMISRRVPQGQVVGVDPSQSMLEFATKYFKKEFFPNLDFVQKKIEDLPPTPSYDVVVAFNSFLWLRDGKRGLTWLSRFLKPGGEILILTYPKESGYYQMLTKGLEKYPQFKKGSAVHTMLRVQDYEEMVEQNEHLEVQEFSVREKIVSHQDEKEICEFMKAWFTNFVLVPKDFQDEFLTYSVKGAAGYGKEQQNGMINLPYIELVIRAKKKES